MDEISLWKCLGECNRELPRTTEFFHKVPTYSRKDGLKSVCKDCLKTREEIRISKDPEGFKKGRKDYRESNKERFQKYATGYRDAHKKPPQPRKVKPIEEAFLEKFFIPEDGEECWEWKGSMAGEGYGDFHYTSENGTKIRMRAHRYSYAHFIEPIPENLQIDHLCKNRKCVNPNHLEPVTLGENVLREDGVTAKNKRKTHCPQGHPYNQENTYIMKNGGRTCLTCNMLNIRAKRGTSHAKSYGTARIRQRKKKSM